MTNDRKSHAREIFMEIIDLPEDERQAKLDELCKDDALLKLDVEVLLQSHEDAEGFMWNPTASAASPSQFVPITEKAGTIIGPYKLLQEIGQGGFGTVFLAEQSKPIRRRVALKIIKLGMDTKQVIARFEAERQALALMDHPNIARVLDAGATDTGRPYFVMEYVVGDSITEFADAHKLSVRDRLDLFNQVCSAVQHAHTKGIIHRDIKPSNILVNMTDGKPFAKVIDFGIAKATAAPLTEKTLFTEHHQLIGTLEYMSPEQAEGLPDIDTRTDVYALGVLLYELLTGHTPIDGKRLRSAAWHEMRRIIKEEEPPAPSMRLSRNIYALAQVATARQTEPGKLSATLKGELDWIAIKALDKDRTRRYETPSALAADVQRHLDGDAVIAAPVSRSYKMRKFIRRNKGVVIAGSTVAAALLLGVVGTTIGLRVAQYNAEVALNNAQIAQSARDELSEVNATLVGQTDEAQWNSYTANLALAQMAMNNGNWPEARTRLAACPESKRGWEWEFLSNKAESVVAEFRGWGYLSPDGTRIFVSAGNSARIYDLEGNVIGKPIRSTSEPFMHGDFSSDSSRILVKFYDNGVRGFQVFTNNGTPIGKVIRPPLDGFLARAINFVGSMVVESSDKSARIWSATGDQIAELAIHPKAIQDIGFSPDGKLIYTTCRDNKVRLWNLEGDQVAAAMPHDARIKSVTFSPDSNRLLTTSGKTAQWWDLGGQKLNTPMMHEEAVQAVSIDPSKKYVITETDSSISIWDWNNNLLSRRPYAWWSRTTRSLASQVNWESEMLLMQPDESSLLISSLSGNTPEITVRPRKNNGGFGFLWAKHMNGQPFITWSYSGDIELWNSTGDRTALFSSDLDSLYGIQLVNDGTRILTSSILRSTYSNSYQVIPLPLPDEIRWIRAGVMRDFLLAAELNRSLSTITTAQSESDLTSAALSLAPNATASAAHPDRSRIVTAAADNTVRFWDPETEKELAAIPMDAGVTNLTFTPDGTRLVIELDDGSARIFDTRSAEEQAADIQRRWAERVPAGEYLDTIMASPTPTADLMATIEADDSLTPIRRLAAAEVLQERLADIRSQADRAFDEITKDQTDQATVLAAAEAINLPPRIKEQVLAKAEAWEYVPPEVTDIEMLARSNRLYRRVEGEELLVPESIEALEGIVKTRTKLFGIDNLDTAEAIHHLGQIKAFANNDPTGLELLRESVDIRLRVLEEPDETALRWLSFLLAAQRELVDLDGVQQSLLQFGELLPKVYSDDKSARRLEVGKMYAMAGLPWFRTPGNEKHFSYEEVQTAAGQFADFGQDENRVREWMVEYSLVWMPGAETDQVALAGLDSRIDKLIAIAPTNSEFRQIQTRILHLQSKFRDVIALLDMPEQSEIASNPFGFSILAMAHFQLAQGLPESDPARAEHLAEANKALAQCQAIMADPSALNDAGQPWAEDRIARSLLAEAEALIGGEGGDDE